MSLSARINALAAALGTIMKSKADLLMGKVPAEQLSFATKEDIMAGGATGKIISPGSIVEAVATLAAPLSLVSSGINFADVINGEVVLTGNLVMGAPTGGFDRKTGEIDLVQDAVGGRTIAFHQNYILPPNFSINTAPNSRTSIPYRCQANGKVRIYNPSKWSE